MRENKGLSLIELIVTLAILGILMGSIFVFISSGSNQYKRNKSDIDLQYEAQLTMNQLEELVIDASMAVTYSGLTDGANEQKVWFDKDLSADSVNEKRLYLYNQDVMYMITWKKADKQLYYSKYPVEADQAIGQPIVDQARMGDYITEFRVNMIEQKNGTKKNGTSVEVGMVFEKQGVSYTAERNITMRNSVLVNVNVDEIYDGSHT